MSKRIILGIDEVGRGPWAGPLVIGAVVLGDETAAEWRDLADSKKLSAAKRASLNSLILEKAVATSLGWVSAEELDYYGLSKSLKLAAERAVKPILAAETAFDEIIIDGTVNFLSETPLKSYVTTLKKADSLVKAVSAASIIAKVARDDYMIDLAETYPQYGFETHVGYGTAKHRAALAEHGVCPEHRRSFRPIAELLSSEDHQITKEVPTKRLRSTTAIGHKAEEQVMKFLREKYGHVLVTRNFRTRLYEVDVITICEGKIYFTEVKYSETASIEGTPLRRIKFSKLRHLALASMDFYEKHPEFNTFQPILAAAAVSGKDFQVDDWFEIKWNG